EPPNGQDKASKGEEVARPAPGTAKYYGEPLSIRLHETPPAVQSFSGTSMPARAEARPALPLAAAQPWGGAGTPGSRWLAAPRRSAPASAPRSNRGSGRTSPVPATG